MGFSLSCADGLYPTDAPVASWPCCRLLGSSGEAQEQQRVRAISALDLRNQETVPAFEEAIQLAGRFLHVPLGWLSIVDETKEYFKATYGLSTLGLGNRLAEERQIPLATSLSTFVLDSEQPLVIPDLAQLPPLARGELLATYGITAYCAVPLITSQRQCIGVLAVMDVVPRPFSQRDVTFLAMAARWGLADYERTRRGSVPPGVPEPGSIAAGRSPLEGAHLHLVGQLVQELRNPLTAVVGMTSMLSREIYGPLTEKQREYTDIVHRSSQTLMGQVDEIIDLGLVSPELSELVPTPLDISQLGQQVMTILASLADKLSQTLDLTVEPEENIWILDQRTVKQILYHGIFSLMQMASENSTIRVHASRKGEALALAFWVSNPWLGEGLPPATVNLLRTHLMALGVPGLEGCGETQTKPHETVTPAKLPENWLGLTLCQHLAHHHGGQIRLHGNAEVGYRLVISLAVLTIAKTPSQMG